MPPVPQRIGPVEFGEPIGKLVPVHAPRDFAAVLTAAGGQWDRGNRFWWVEVRRIGPLVRRLQGVVDPLFAAAGLPVDGGTEEGHAERRTRGA